MTAMTAQPLIASRSAWRHLPNALTIARMALVLPLAWLMLDARYGAALLVAAIAGLTDALDGFLAKRCGWRSWLGGILDPLADKFMLIVCFITLGLIGAHPAWLTVLVVGRDVVIVAGAVAYHSLIGRIDAQPTLVSKLTTFVQILYVLAQLVHLTEPLELPSWVPPVLIWVVAICTLVSGVQYVAVWSAKALRASKGEP